MIASLLVLILVTSCLAADPNPVGYTGFRVTFKKDLLQGYYVLDLKEATGAVAKHAWENMNFTAGSGLFSAAFFMKDLKCTAKFEESKGSVKKFNVANSRIEMDLAGAMVSFEYAFNYEFHLFNIPFFAGTAKLHYTSSLISLDQNFTYSDAPTAFKIAWTTVVDSITGLDLFGSITKSINTLAPKLGIALANVYASEFQIVTMNVLKHWMELKHPMYENNLLDMTLHNSMLAVHEYPAGFVILGFFTKISVDDRPYNKLIWKTLYTDVPADNATLIQTCIATNLVTGIAEIRGKARDFLFRIKPADLGLSGKVSDLLPIIPGLDEFFGDDETLTVGCRPNGDNDIVMVKTANDNTEHATIQIPINCQFGGLPTGKLALSVNFVMRATVKKVFEEDGKLLAVNAYAHDTKLYSYKVDSSIAPVADFELIIRMLNKLGAKLENFQLLPKPLSIPITFEPASKTGILTDAEYCVNYA